ncbi:hypothetical protein Nepgr_019128 [Nepenthes gracilis]|uniref:Pectinesterase inhibitor domain-containing protein n=1 Tax=Nepenthes gracilis TaxID=150966 RepID=A0AAD3SUG8_NEPGR|nr:hypothetical protein Nepgr_019128 [Nepenthes gracilis]
MKVYGNFKAPCNAFSYVSVGNLEEHTEGTMASIRFLAYVCYLLVICAASVHGNEELIEKLCSVTIAPDDYCPNCLRSNPRSSELNARELAGTAIFCAYNQSTLAQDAFSSYASSAYIPPLKAAYSSCASITDSIGEKITVALNSWGDGNYKDSESKLNSSRDDVVTCRTKLADGFARAGRPPFPKDLGEKFKGLLALVTVAEQILEEID